MKRPLLSIITVVYNGAATLENTIRSVAGQTFKDFEYVIVDGGSKDSTIGIIKKHSETVSRWISEPDKGIYDAMNKGIRLAEGEWLYFLGSDDLFQDEQVLASVFSDAEMPFDLVYGDVLSPSYNGRYDGAFTYEKLLRRNLSHQAAFYRKELFLRLGDFDLRYRMHADWDFNLRCFQAPSVRTHYNGVLVATFGEGGVSAGHDMPFLRERLIPAKLSRLNTMGLKTLRHIRLYDEWWRSLRNAGFRDPSLQLQYLPGAPKVLQGMLRHQRAVPAVLLKRGAVSKLIMFSSYLINRLTASI